MKRKWLVTFEENGSEYVGNLLITATKVTADKTDINACIADGVHIRIDERIIDISRDEQTEG